MWFRNCGSNADKAKLYENVRKRLLETYEDESEAFRPADWFKGIPSKSENRKETNKKKIFSCSRESQEFESKIFWTVTTRIRSGSGQCLFTRVCYTWLKFFISCQFYSTWYTQFKLSPWWYKISSTINFRQWPSLEYYRPLQENYRMYLE